MAQHPDHAAPNPAKIQTRKDPTRRPPGSPAKQHRPAQLTSHLPLADTKTGHPASAHSPRAQHLNQAAPNPAKTQTTKKPTVPRPGSAEGRQGPGRRSAGRPPAAGTTMTARLPQGRRRGREAGCRAGPAPGTAPGPAAGGTTLTPLARRASRGASTAGWAWWTRRPVLVPGRPIPPGTTTAAWPGVRRRGRAAAPRPGRAEWGGGPIRTCACLRRGRLPDGEPGRGPRKSPLARGWGGHAGRFSRCRSCAPIKIIGKVGRRRGRRRGGRGCRVRRR
jgi:hypothetical protein